MQFVLHGGVKQLPEGGQYKDFLRYDFVLLIGAIEYAHELAYIRDIQPQLAHILTLLRDDSQLLRVGQFGALELEILLQLIDHQCE